MSDHVRRTRRLLVDDLDAGFERVVRDHVAGISTFVRRIAGHAADDVVQETFLRAFRALQSMAPDDIAALDVRPWLFTIARHAAYNAHRSAVRRPTVSADADADGGVVRRADAVVDTAAEQPDNAAERSETVAELRRALDALPDVQRDAVVLRHVLDLSSRDAAAVLGVPENTLKSHVARGLAALRQTLTLPTALSKENTS
jgi:RNA polymerase sigma factor (sigma-70 family)